MEADAPEASLVNGRELITRANQLHSPLLRLPAELRNAIYGMVFSNTLVRIRAQHEQSYLYPPGKHGGRTLPHVCRQLHLETQNMLASLAKFDIHGRSIESFVNYLGTEKAALIGRIIAYRGDHLDKEHAGSWELLGKLKGLKRVSVSGFKDLNDLKGGYLGFALEWATGGLVHADDLTITIRRSRHASRRTRA